MKRRLNNGKTTVKVIKNWNGCRGELVETIERTPQWHSGRTKKRNRRTDRFRTVSYKGKQYKIFMLPECYGEIEGLVISIDQ